MGHKSIILDSPPLWEKIFAVLALFFSTYAVIPLLLKEQGTTYQIVMLILWSIIYGMTFCFLLLRRNQVARIALKAKSIWILAGLALVSCLWSNLPFVSLYRSLALLGTTAFGLYLAAGYTRQDLLQLLLWTFGLSALLSLGFILCLPAYGIQNDIYHSGAWRGVYIHKNMLGVYMAFGGVTCLVYALCCHRGRLAAVLLGVVSLVLLYFSASKTAVVVLLILMALLLIFRLIHCRYIKVAPVVMIVLLLAGLVTAWLINNISTVLAVMERDTTLSGRTVLWQAVWDMIQQRLLLGYGYGSFWLGTDGPAKYIWIFKKWNLDHAHNGYLELWLQLGLAGVVVFILSAIANLFKAFVLWWRKDSLIDLLPLLFLVFMLFHNILESMILLQNNFFWILYVFYALQLGSEAAPGVKNIPETDGGGINNQGC